jgi:hypothetical protein
MLLCEVIHKRRVRIPKRPSVSRSPRPRFQPGLWDQKSVFRWARGLAAGAWRIGALLALCVAFRVR